MTALTSSSVLIGAAGQVQGTPPEFAIDFESSSSQSVSISNANLGSFNRSLFSVSWWYKRESIDAAMSMYSKGAGANLEFQIKFFASNKIDFICRTAGTPQFPRLTTTATFTDTSSYHHLYAIYDEANATTGDRMILIHDGSEITVFDTDTFPNDPVQSASGNAIVGAQDDSSSYFDGLIYQAALFDGSKGALPSINDLYDSGSPLPVTGIASLHSLLDVAGGDVTSDPIIGLNWNATNAPTSSATIPT